MRILIGWGGHYVKVNELYCRLVGLMSFSQKIEQCIHCLISRLFSNSVLIIISYLRWFIFTILNQLAQPIKFGHDFSLTLDEYSKELFIGVVIFEERHYMEERLLPSLKDGFKTIVTFMVVDHNERKINVGHLCDKLAVKSEGVGLHRMDDALSSTIVVGCAE